MITHYYNIAISQISAEIGRAAAAAGATHARLIDSGHSDGRFNNPNSLVDFYAFSDVDGHEIRVAETNSELVWEEDDSEAFLNFADKCDVDLLKPEEK